MFWYLLGFLLLQFGQAGGGALRVRVRVGVAVGGRGGLQGAGRRLAASAVEVGRADVGGRDGGGGRGEGDEGAVRGRRGQGAGLVRVLRGHHGQGPAGGARGARRGALGPQGGDGGGGTLRTSCRRTVNWTTETQRDSQREPFNLGLFNIF